MKIAYTVNGIFGGLSGKNYEGRDSEIDPTIDIAKFVYKSLDERILKNNDVDIFLFSWHKDKQKELEEIYKPKKSLFMEQAEFVDLPDHLKDREPPRVQAHISKWYGFKEVMRLRKEYEQENNVEYDLVVNARLDHFWNKDINFSNFDTEKVHLSKFNDRVYGWPTDVCHEELLGDIFVMKPEYMDEFANMFDKLSEYTSPGQCPQWRVISHHFLVVWHLEKMGLLKEDIIEFSFKTTFPSRFCTQYPAIENQKYSDSSYMILRYKMEIENLSRKDILL